ncbi:hypothetical protein ABZ760_12285 [Streptomyces sp. NPDC006658]|uniref:hypothetical protein n=1 Tax=Streptomyces sp. NPDC006658 TaxID=3156900 RepID=UPI0033DFC8BE
MALDAALQGRVHSVLVPDTEIIRARQMLCDHRRLAAATAPAALTPTSTTATPARPTAAPTCPPAATARQR